MKDFLKADPQYLLLLKNYTKKDGFKAILLYLLYMVLCFSQAFLFTTNLSVRILDSSHIVNAVLHLMLVFPFIWLSKDKLTSIGLTVKNIGKSIVGGIIGAILLLGFVVIYQIIAGANHVSFQINPPMVIFVFIICAIAEEIVFRGYIQTRITGIIKNRFAASCINAILFLSIHYPVKWVAIGGFSLGVLSGFYVLCLILLHFLCDFIYKKTNCLWGSIILHQLYNIFTAMLILG